MNKIGNSTVVKMLKSLITFEFIKKIGALFGDIEQLNKKMDHLIALQNSTLLSQHEYDRPLELKTILWDSRSEPFCSPERRWEWIDKATTLFRKQCRVFSTSSATVVCRVLGRYWFKFDGDAGLVQKRLMTEGCWELFLTEALTHEIELGMTVVDIGANIGYYSVIMADYVGPTGRVYVCEPAPFLRSNLESTFEFNWIDDDRIIFIDRPLYNESGKDIYFTIPTDVKNAHLTSAPSTEQGFKSIPMKTVKLDDIIPDGKQVDVIKIDAEGAEFDIWIGMKRVIAQSKRIKIFLEFNAGRNYNSLDFLHNIVSNGFRIQALDEFRGVIETSIETLTTQKVGYDWILVLTKH